MIVTRTWDRITFKSFSSIINHPYKTQGSLVFTHIMTSSKTDTPNTWKEVLFCEPTPHLSAYTTLVSLHHTCQPAPHLSAYTPLVSLHHASETRRASQRAHTTTSCQGQREVEVDASIIVVSTPRSYRNDCLRRSAYWEDQRLPHRTPLPPETWLHWWPTTPPTDTTHSSWGVAEDVN